MVQLRAEIDAGPLDNNISIFSLIEYGLRRRPESPAVICLHESADQLDDLLEISQPHQRKCGIADTDHLTLSYKQLHRAAVRLAAGLRANGVAPGSTLLMLVPNGGQYALLLWTCILARLTVVSMDPAEVLDDLKSQRIVSILEETRPEVVVVPGAIESETMNTIVDATSLKTSLKVSLIKTPESEWKGLTELISDGDAHPIEVDAMVEEARRDNPDRLYSIMFTSGTSARPKGCPLRVGGAAHMVRSWSWLVNQSNCSHALQQAHNSRGIAPAQTIQTWAAGGAVVMTGRGFDVEDMLDAIKLHYATFVVLTPAMAHSLAAHLEMQQADLTTVRTVQVGGDAVTKSVLSKCNSLFPHADVCINHGMTEGGACFEWPFSGTPPSSIPFFGQICPVGKPAPGAAVRIWDSEKEGIATRGRAGQLHLSSDSIIRKYLHGGSASSFYNQDGKKWFITGDAAMMAGDGTVYILGRSKDMMLCKGHIVMPFVIESCLEDLTGTQASVVAIPDPVHGQQPFAILTALDQNSSHDIRNQVVRLLGTEYELGGIVSLEALGMTAFPVNDTQKIIKPQIKEAVQSYINRVGAGGMVQ
ncbi:putative Acyl--CoA ligase [Seiridium cardinale]|uniref:Acyl--CoA ligase n=1 Tax=Seiridium cardinale TaxID=138064 RepID=A0ABR2YAL1_9PEZI